MALTPSLCSTYLVKCTLVKCTVERCSVVKCTARKMQCWKNVCWTCRCVVGAHLCHLCHPFSEAQRDCQPHAQQRHNQQCRRHHHRHCQQRHDQYDHRHLAPTSDQGDYHVRLKISLLSSDTHVRHHLQVSFWKLIKTQVPNVKILSLEWLRWRLSKVVCPLPPSRSFVILSS